jgi:argininosuccinate lyase
MALLTVMKGLPLAYNRDMQEDKGPLFDSGDTLIDCLTVMAAMLTTLRFNVNRFADRFDYIVATDLADYLVRKGMSFRTAHSVIGKLVRTCINRKISLKELPLRDYRRHSNLFTRDLFSILDARASVSGKKSLGSTSPGEVKKALRMWKTRLS